MLQIADYFIVTLTGGGSIIALTGSVIVLTQYYFRIYSFDYAITTLTGSSIVLTNIIITLTNKGRNLKESTTSKSPDSVNWGS